jgi:voltage-gated potassium channel
MAMTRRHGWLGAIAFTALLIGLIVAAEDIAGWSFVVVLFSLVIASVAFFGRLFPGTWFFVIAMVNALGVYACIFIYFVTTNFAGVAVGALVLGFALPPLAFLLGAWLRRERIRAIVHMERVPGARHVRHALAWLAPLAAIGLLSFAAPTLAAAIAARDLLFLIYMAAIAAVVAATSADIATFLIDTGLLFEEFLERIAQLIVPIFAFMTFYSILVIMFATIYRIVSRYGAPGHFLVNGKPHELSFADSIYFSIVTMATVGYGDIAPASDLARMVAAMQVVAGVLLLLFGFSELMAYARERHKR